MNEITRAFEHVGRKLLYDGSCGFVRARLCRAGAKKAVAVANLEGAGDLRAAMSVIVAAEVAESDPPYAMIVASAYLVWLPLKAMRRILREALAFLRSQGLLLKRRRANEVRAVIRPGAIPEGATDALVEQWLVPSVINRLLEQGRVA